MYKFSIHVCHYSSESSSSTTKVRALALLCGWMHMLPKPSLMYQPNITFFGPNKLTGIIWPQTPTGSCRVYARNVPSEE